MHNIAYSSSSNNNNNKKAINDKTEQLYTLIQQKTLPFLALHHQGLGGVVKNFRFLNIYSHHYFIALQTFFGQMPAAKNEKKNIFLVFIK